jgi:hypothetical protein
MSFTKLLNHQMIKSKTELHKKLLLILQNLKIVI